MRTPKRLTLIAMLFLPTVALYYTHAVLAAIRLAGYSDPLSHFGGSTFFWFAFSSSGIVVACYTTWSLATFRPLGRWLALGLFCATTICMLSAPAHNTPFYTKQRIILNRCLFCIPYVLSVYYLLHSAFTTAYSAASQERKIKQSEAQNKAMDGTGEELSGTLMQDVGIEK